MNTEQVEKLQPEYARALGVLDANLDKLHPSPVTQLSEKIWQQNNIAMFYGAFAAKHIPSGDLWRWNQTRSRKKTFIPHRNTSVEIVKLIPRKRKVETPSSHVPVYKLWMLVLSSHYSTATVIWCEKGANSTFFELPRMHEAKQEISTQQNGLCLQDYAFLADFMTPEDAKMFWPSHCS